MHCELEFASGGVTESYCSISCNKTKECSCDDMRGIKRIRPYPWFLDDNIATKKSNVKYFGSYMCVPFEWEDIFG